MTRRAAIQQTLSGDAHSATRRPGPGCWRSARFGHSGPRLYLPCPTRATAQRMAQVLASAERQRPAAAPRRQWPSATTPSSSPDRGRCRSEIRRRLAGREATPRWSRRGNPAARAVRIAVADLLADRRGKKLGCATEVTGAVLTARPPARGRRRFVPELGSRAPARLAVVAMGRLGGRSWLRPTRTCCSCMISPRGWTRARPRGPP
jgi:hypothetical protein